MKARFYGLTFLLAMITLLFFRLWSWPVIENVSGIWSDWVPVLFLILVFVFVLLALFWLYSLQSSGLMMAALILAVVLAVSSIASYCFLFGWLPLMLSLKVLFLFVYLIVFILWLVFLSDIALQKIKGF